MKNTRDYKHSHRNMQITILYTR